MIKYPAQQQQKKGKKSILKDNKDKVIDYLEISNKVWELGTCASFVFEKKNVLLVFL